MDFYRIIEKKAVNTSKNRDVGHVEVYPDFYVGRSKDLMVRGHDFYAIWDSKKNTWLTDQLEVARLIDDDLWRHGNKLIEDGELVYVKTMSSDDTGMWKKFLTFVKNMPNNFKPLDSSIVFANDPMTRDCYSSHHLPYALEDISTPNYDRLMNVFYLPEEREKLEWAVGAVLLGESKRIQKFIVLYGESGSGKSTFLNILQKLTEGYYISFNAKNLANNASQFATEIFKNNPLVAIQHDGDLSKIEDNSTLNSIISHEPIVVNEKHKSQYDMSIDCFMFMGTNKVVKIPDAKSGLIRRLIDVTPTGNKVSQREYDILVRNINFELGGIASRCINVFKSLGSDYYNGYRPTNMLYATNVIFNFVEDNLLIFKKNECLQLKQIYDMYKQHCAEVGIATPMLRQSFREELKIYFKEFYESYLDESGVRKRSVFIGVKSEMFEPMPKGQKKKEVEEVSDWLILQEQTSLLDTILKDCPAQEANEHGVPPRTWDKCKTVLNNINTKKIHYVRPELSHIVIDFDIKDASGKKNREKNIEAASKWPATYVEASKSGEGLHLHYIYDGDPTLLTRIYAEDIEVKVFVGNSSLRRKLSCCNNVAIAHISSGIPMQEKKGDGMVDKKIVENEKHLRILIKKCLNKEFHGYTKPECDFIFKLLDEAHKSNIVFDVTDLRPAVLQFAASSKNNNDYCVNLVSKMKFASEQQNVSTIVPEGRLVFYDVEVFKNLFLVCYKEEGPDKKIVSLYNPSPSTIEKLFSSKLVGFNNKRYDDHMLYACYLGYDNLQLYDLSKKIITKEGSIHNGFREAYNLAYTDIYDFSSKKQSLKKWQVELGMHHQEFEFDFNEPLPKEYWPLVEKYCHNDVLTTEALFEHLKADYVARIILAELAGATPNHTTNQLTTKIVFGNVKNPELVYTNMADLYPGYEFVKGEDGKMHNMYRGTDLGFGGYVAAKPGMYWDVPILDVQSMHPSSIILLNYFGIYTKNYSDLKDARVAIKNEDFEKARTMLNGKLAPYLNDVTIAEQLAYALKIALNSAYGLTSAAFENAMRDKRNVNNIIALCGALFMRTLQDEVEQRGFIVAHIKTDSIKIPNATPEIIQFCIDFAAEHGYVFEHEATYEKMCLVNNAVYIAKYQWAQKKKNIGKWSATGAQFAEPYVFKSLFSKEVLSFDDYKQTKTVTSPAVMYLDFNESDSEKHNYIHVGKVGSFIPVQPGCGGGTLLRKKDDKYSAVVGTKGYRWKESEIMDGKEDQIDIVYFTNLATEAVQSIQKYGDYDSFVD